jgi:hypothetical protein
MTGFVLVSFSKIRIYTVCVLEYRSNYHSFWAGITFLVMLYVYDV